MPAATAEIFERESKEFLADVELFFEAESAASTSTPIGFEVSFGRPLDDDEEEPLARAEPVEIDLGRGLTFRIAGRMDRIDQVGPSSFEVLDYKTGGFWRDSWTGHVRRRPSSAARALWTRRGRTAQDAVTRIRRSTRACITSRATRDARNACGSRLRRARAIAAVLGDLRDVIIKGQFVRTPDEDNCQYCDYAAACGEQRELAGGREDSGCQARCTGGLPPMSESRVDRSRVAPAIREELLTNILVEAGAGSGKTQMLAERMAAGVAGGVYQVEHMAAVTFTRKAASELRGRFHLALEAELSKARDASPGDDAGHRAHRAHRVGAVESRALLRRDDSFVLRAAAARASGRIRRVAWLHRARTRCRTSSCASVPGASSSPARAQRGDPDMPGAHGGGRDSPRISILRSRRSASTTMWSFRRVTSSALIQRGVEGAGEVLEGTAETSARRRSIRQRHARFRKPRGNSAEQLRVSRYRLDRASVIAALLGTWDCDSKIVQKWWADSPAEKRRLRDLIQGLHQEFRDDGRRAVSAINGASTSTVSRSRCWCVRASLRRPSAAVSTR